MIANIVTDFLTNHGRALFGIAAFIYGLFAVFRFASGKIKRKGNGELPAEAIFHVMVWTFAPPLWFGFEATVIGTTEEGQKLAGNIWAAVLAAILFLVREVKEPRAIEKGVSDQGAPPPSPARTMEPEAACRFSELLAKGYSSEQAAAIIAEKGSLHR